MSDGWKFRALDSYPGGHWFDSQDCKYENQKGYIGNWISSESLWFVFWFQTSTKQTYESILMWLFLILEIWWWRIWLFCFCWLWESKVLNLTKMLSMQAQRLNLWKSIVNLCSEAGPYILLRTRLRINSHCRCYYLALSEPLSKPVSEPLVETLPTTTSLPAWKRSRWSKRDPMTVSSKLHVFKFISFFLTLPLLWVQYQKEKVQRKTKY